MILKELRIELQPNYTTNAGKYEGKVTYEGEKGNVTLILDPQVSEALLSFIGPVITKFSQKVALELEENLKLSVAAANQLPPIEQVEA